MPLPDERPRGSVANLIGRFETQVKRQSSSSPASARSLSATSHMSGDSAKEEAKERHEWPPKSTSSDAKAPVTIPSSSFARSLALAQAVSVEATLEIPATQIQADIVEAASLTPRPHSTTSNSDPKPVATTPAQRQYSIDVIPSTPITSGTLTTAKPPTTARPPSTRTSTEATGKLSAMTYGPTPVKFTGVRTNPAVQPIKSQNTGPSRKPVAKPMPPSTSAKAGRSATNLASMRPKTPSIQSRTPSSGLFAPTAASLARSRNAQQPPVPTSTKKVTMSSAAAERLSKPTAASLSRTRTTTAAGTKPAASASLATRGTPASKPKTSTTGTLAKKTGTSTVKKAAAAAVGAATAIAAVAEPEPVSELPPAENGHHTDDDHVDERPEGALNPEKHPPKQKSSVSGDSLETDAEPVVNDQQLNDNAVEDANNKTGVVSPDKLESYSIPLEQFGKAEPAPVNDDDDEATKVKPGANVGNEIEDMVNLLETVSMSKARPESIVTIPDEE